MYLIFDTETTGLPKRWNAPYTTRTIGLVVYKLLGNCMMPWGIWLESQDYLVQPDGFNIPYDAEQIHGISTELAQQKGISIGEVLEKFNTALSKTKFVVGQNVGFDLNIMGAEFHQIPSGKLFAGIACLGYLYRTYGAIMSDSWWSGR